MWFHYYELCMDYSLSLTWQHGNITQLQLTLVYYEYFSTCDCEYNVARGSHASPDPPVPIKAFPFCFVSFPLFDGITMYLNIMWAKIELCIVYAHIILASKRLTALSLNMNTNNNRIITSAEFFHPQKRFLTSNPRSASHITAPIWYPYTIQQTGHENTQTYQVVIVSI